MRHIYSTLVTINNLHIHIFRISFSLSNTLFLFSSLRLNGDIDRARRVQRSRWYKVYGVRVCPDTNAQFVQINESTTAYNLHRISIAICYYMTHIRNANDADECFNQFHHRTITRMRCPQTKNIHETNNFFSEIRNIKTIYRMRLSELSVHVARVFIVLVHIVENV